MSSGYLVVMADDDNEDQLLMKHAFEENNLPATLHFVEDGVELFEYLEKQGPSGKLPSLILLDLNMPRMSGKEVLQKIKADAVLKKIPVIIFSTSSLDSDIEHCYEFGASSYITKPSGYSHLVTIAKNISNYWFESVDLPPICAQ